LRWRDKPEAWHAGALQETKPGPFHHGIQRSPLMAQLMIPVKREATLISSVSRPSTASDDGGTRSSSTPGDLSSRGHWHLPQHGRPAMWCICGGIGMQTCHSGWQVLKRLNVVAAGHRGHRSTGITPNDVSSNVASKDSNGLSSTQAEALAKVSRMRAWSRQTCTVRRQAV
jgi:hypothetical protein